MEQACFNFMAAVTVCSDFGAQENKIKSVTVSTFSPSICHEVMGLDAIIFVFQMLSFKPAFSLSYFTFIKRLLSSSSLSAIRVMSSAYLRKLIFLPAILIPASASSSPAFHIMYSAYKLNKHGDNIQPWHIWHGTTREVKEVVFLGETGTAILDMHSNLIWQYFFRLSWWFRW